MSRPKNTTAPPKAQQLPKSLAECAGFEYFEVQVVGADAGFKHSYPGLLDEAIAKELKSMLEPEVYPNSVGIIWAAGWADQFEGFLRTDGVMTDLIKSVRSAERPGNELRARLGQFGPYEGYAPRSARSEIVARDSEVLP
jgi:hypothetical protein